MASPQKENGFTPISNELLEAIYSSPFSLREMKIVLSVIRFTYGFSRKETELSLRFLSNATNVSFQHLSKTITDLILKNVLFISKSETRSQGRKYILNKDYEAWNFEISQKRNSSQKGYGRVPKKVTVGVPKKVTKKEKKENIKKENSFFENLIPEEKKTDSFIESWKEWINYRKEIKKPIKETTAKKQLQFLLQQKDPELIINNSIKNGWQGLFPISQNNSSKKIISALPAL